MIVRASQRPAKELVFQNAVRISAANLPQRPSTLNELGRSETRRKQFQSVKHNQLWRRPNIPPKSQEKSNPLDSRRVILAFRREGEAPRNDRNGPTARTRGHDGKAAQAPPRTGHREGKGAAMRGEASQTGETARDQDNSAPRGLRPPGRQLRAKARTKTPTQCRSAEGSFSCTHRDQASHRHTEPAARPADAPHSHPCSRRATCRKTPSCQDANRPE